jgi:hypothetical protein
MFPGGRNVFIRPNDARPITDRPKARRAACLPRREGNARTAAPTTHMTNATRAHASGWKCTPDRNGLVEDGTDQSGNVPPTRNRYPSTWDTVRPAHDTVTNGRRKQTAARPKKADEALGEAGLPQLAPSRVVGTSSCGPTSALSPRRQHRRSVPLTLVSGVLLRPWHRYGAGPRSGRQVPVSVPLDRGPSHTQRMSGRRLRLAAAGPVLSPVSLSSRTGLE